VEAVAELASLLPVATLSNVCYADDDGSVARVLGPYLNGHYPSYRLGYAKPDPRTLHAVADAHGVSPEVIVHIGDSVECDVRAALRAGARAVWISGGPHQAAPPDLAAVGDRFSIAPTLTNAVACVRHLLDPSHPLSRH
jgi:FMN phosphatase YigB (HAD superfamily)